ncbi:SDR family oxidoreductase [Natronomonas salina]|uniref:SDR family oxidoreductase n=1 Tax=Natronomonas salina TaxID=1710540 RepID=UPI0015B7745E|nr:SDR family oxidoreductase [Natronomonas salina]QLD89303.1 SDR family oxidoreductase [Natronomonas salina]
MVEKATLDGRTAIVTGASSGIGQETAHALADAGADVALAARRRERLETLADEVESETDAEALVVPTNVRNEDEVEELVETTVAEFGGLDLLVNNAGTAAGSEVASMATEEYRTMMEVNVDGMFFATRAALPHLRESGGTLIFVGSFAGKYPRPFNPVYAASKWWTRGFAQSVSAQVGDDDVGVTVVNPSEVRTEFGSEYGESFEERFDEGEVTEPEEIAEAIRYAAGQSPSMAAEIDLYRRDKFTMF